MTDATVHIKDIESAVCHFFQITPQELRSARPSREHCRRRFIAVRLARELTPLSFPQLGNWLHKDHSTLVHGDQQARELLQSNPEFAGALAAVREIMQHQTPYLERLRKAQSDFGGLTAPKPAALDPAPEAIDPAPAPAEGGAP